MNALLAHDVGRYINRHFASAFQKVATFQKLGNGQKNGGNVATYFCTPDGYVIHAIAGPVDSSVFLREARWANETYQTARMGEPTLPTVRRKMRDAHLERLTRLGGLNLRADDLARPENISEKGLRDLIDANAGMRASAAVQVHMVLGVGAMPRLETVYRPVFEGILNERVTNEPVIDRGF